MIVIADARTKMLFSLAMRTRRRRSWARKGGAGDVTVGPNCLKHIKYVSVIKIEYFLSSNCYLNMKYSFLFIIEFCRLKME